MAAIQAGMGNGYAGNKGTSTANLELVAAPGGWDNTVRPFSYYQFTFVNTADCHVVINKKFTLLLAGNQGFRADIYDAPITSFVITETSIPYSWVGGY